MARRVPPFAAVRAFEAAARHGGLQAAADELSVSTSAVSHQIKSLEEFLGAKVFLRSGNQLSLTELGAGYRDDLSQALDLIEVATVRALRRQEGRRVTVNLFFSLAELWLIPLLGSFHEAQPDIELRLVTQPEDADLAGTDIDLAVRYAALDDVAPDLELLFEEDIVPVCAPAFLAASGPQTKPDDLLAQRLILCSGEAEEWSLWASAQGASLTNAQTWLELDQRTFVMQAARKGLGVAMARRPYADTDLAEGALVAPIPRPLRTGHGYFLEVPARTRSLPDVKAFRAWLLAHCRERMAADQV